ncbi:hypothetical protein DL764_003055 [Monosporascus ibericus]|uniref:Steroid 5-alpha reductase C-terminal domain-containing protein n=1 Tax=Monosporascus ibericus TaxID=155417 RepID=A0A4Q4TMQ2_9PEZI|nr:hypothetical protein DL764_003055 [Monosporascus ibericus]
MATSPPSPRQSAKQHLDLVQRGRKKPSPLGTATFVGLRLLDIPLQYALLSPSYDLGRRLLSVLHITPIPVLSPSLLITGIPALDGLGAGGAVLVAMAAGSSLKQILWVTYLSAEEFPPRAAVTLGLFNALFNSVNSLLFLAAATTSLRSLPTIVLPSSGRSSRGMGALPLSVAVGAALYATGLALETASEWQRRTFKARPENADKVCKVGLWRWARHINYFGYSLWSGAYAMAASGWIGGLAVGFLVGRDLGTRAVDELDEYCGGRYGEQWAQFKREVPYRIVPGFY